LLKHHQELVDDNFLHYVDGFDYIPFAFVLSIILNWFSVSRTLSPFRLLNNSAIEIYVTSNSIGLAIQRSCLLFTALTSHVRDYFRLRRITRVTANPKKIKPQRHQRQVKKNKKEEGT
jgi:hypothetical protein